ncbi:MAG: YabP/YqfC family sporulation protein [Oscillospiraceae bacterium]
MTIEKQNAVLSPTQPHKLVIENRRMLCATGIISIVSYDEYAATLETQLGTLVIGGKDIRVSELSVQTGEVKVLGEIEYIQYAAKNDKSQPFYKRLVR